VKKIELFNFGDLETPAYCGLLVDKTSGSAHLFEISENGHQPSLSHNIGRACARVRQSKFPDSTIDQIKWRLTCPPRDIDVTFKSLGKAGLELDIPKGNYGESSFFSLKDYERYLNAPEGFENAVPAARETSKGKTKKVWLISVPEYPGGIFSMESDTPEQAVLADATKLKREWLATTKSRERAIKISQLADIIGGKTFSYPNDNTLEILNCPPNQSKRFMFNFSNIETQPVADVSHYARKPLDLIRGYNGLGFVNGRHRTANLISLGAEFVPLNLRNDSKEQRQFLKNFGYTADAKSTSHHFESVLSNAPLHPQTSIRPTAYNRPVAIITQKPTSLFSKLSKSRTAAGLAVAAGAALVSWGMATFIDKFDNKPEASPAPTKAAPGKPLTPP